ncbi:MFS transporter [Epibacterium sp. Ofav1-8]|uniref:MFS transporter n=1 Tax=Epibacterium sp. Ofav1-8 TaxID=2917735 RepID=UPI001EF720A5|nr:MFS transporter [Epibacterium sp. Ofav1-8]MCG7624684.1 MFS transporter [Epibacterium sp. Ofav1-8]
MLHLFHNRTYRHLFAAQVIALLGTGLATVALGLAAYDIAGDRAGSVLGTALAIKMISYVTLAPIAAALADRVPRRMWLVMLDLIRAAVVLGLPFVSSVWQIYGLVFLLQAASAGFTPAFQATIPDILPDEEDYTRALSLSRLAYDLESLASPALAALLLTVVSAPSLFFGTALGFALSALLVISVRLPAARPQPPRGFYDRTTRGLRIYLRTPRLRGLLGLSLAAAAVSSMVFVNTVVMVRGSLGLGEGEVALVLGAFGAGSMLTALFLPALLDQLQDRKVMQSFAALGCASLCATAVWSVAGLTLSGLLLCWFLAGIGYSGTLTPAGRLLRRSAHPEDRAAVFAAQFTLSHACWLLCYPLAGLGMTYFGQEVILVVLALIGIVGLLAGSRAWPLGSAAPLPHAHPDLPDDHPHLLAHPSRPHTHPVVIDDLHPHYPPLAP